MPGSPIEYVETNTLERVEAGVKLNEAQSYVVELETIRNKK